MKISILVFGLVFANTSQAMLITSASDVALAGGVTETFNGFTTGTYPSGLASSTFTIQNPSNRNKLEVLDTTYFSYAGVNSSSNFLHFIYEDKRFGSGALDFVSNPLKIIFNQPTTAFGFNYAPDCSSFEMAFYSVLDELIESYTIPFNPNDLKGFVGASSTQNIAYFVLKETGIGGSGSFDEGYLDNLTTVSSVPILGAVPLFLSGLGVLGFARRKLI